MTDNGMSLSPRTAVAHLRQGGFAKYARAYSIGFQNGLEYRSDFFLGLFSAVFPIVIQLYMWIAIYGKSDTALVFGYTHAQMAVYTVLAALLNRIQRTGFEYQISKDIKDGGLDKFIIRPIRHMPYRFMNFLGVKTAGSLFGFVFLIGAVVVLSLTIGGTTSVLGVLMFIPIFVLSFVMNFLLFYALSAIAFWLSEIGFFFEAVRIVFIALSGGIFPLSVLGRGAETVLNLLPFRYMINFPVDVLCGRIGMLEAFGALGVELAWILALALFSGWIWKIGMTKYVAAGG